MENKNEFGFLYKNLKTPSGTISRLLQIEDFSVEMRRLANSSTTITDEVLHGVVKEIYFPMLKDNVRCGDALALRRAARTVSKLLTGNSASWQADYEEWLSAK